MSCSKPMLAVRKEDGSVRFLSHWGDHHFEWLQENMPDVLRLSCGQCLGCRMARSRSWAARIMHEASLYKENSFITLTYNDDHNKPSLDYRDFQLFMKRLRKRVNTSIRFYMCGEYGSINLRGHFHACIFNYSFPDRKVWRKTKSGSLIYRSALLEDVWTFGFSSIGDLTYQSAAYVARYILSKRTGFMATDYYQSVDPETGEVIKRLPEFTKMSLKPGIGKDWIDKYESDVFPHDYLIINGHKNPVPRYYRDIYKRALTEEQLIEFEEYRNESFAKLKNNLKLPRVRAKHEILKHRSSLLKRNI